MKMINNAEGVLSTGTPIHLQCQHEEADTLIAFHANSISSGNILVRSTDTDVLVILLGLCGRRDGIGIIMDYGSGNNRRYIDVSKIAAILEETQPGMTEALIGLHSLTGCDFTSCFYRKGKAKPLKKVESNAEYVRALRSLTTDEVNIEGVTLFVCSLYGFTTSDINDARNKAFLRMSTGKGNEALAKLKKINWASLPPCAKTLYNHIKRAQYVARIWRSADQTEPTGGESAMDYGWKLSHNCFQLDWFVGSSVPESLVGAPENDCDSGATTSTDDHDPDDAWSEDRDDDEDLHDEEIEA